MAEAKMRDIGLVDHNLIKEGMKILNGAELLEEKLRIVGVKKEAMYQSFIGAVKGLAEAGKEDQLPEETVNAYNHLFTEPAEEEKKAAAEKSTKPAAKKDRGPSQKGIAREMLKGGSADEDIIAACVDLYAKNGKADKEWATKRAKKTIADVRIELGMKKPKKEKKEEAPAEGGEATGEASTEAPTEDGETSGGEAAAAPAE